MRIRTRTGCLAGSNRLTGTEDHRLLLVLAHVTPVVLNLLGHSVPLRVDAAKRKVHRHLWYTVTLVAQF